MGSEILKHKKNLVDYAEKSKSMSILLNVPITQKYFHKKS